MYLASIYSFMTRFAIVFEEFLFLIIWAAEGVVCGIEGKLHGVGH